MSKPDLDDVISTIRDYSIGHSRLDGSIQEVQFMVNDYPAKKMIKEFFLELADSVMSNDYVASERFISWLELREAIEEL